MNPTNKAIKAPPNIPISVVRSSSPKSEPAFPVDGGASSKQKFIQKLNAMVTCDILWHDALNLLKKTDKGCL